MEFSDLRRDFGNFSMDEKKMMDMPSKQLQFWLKQASDHEIKEFNAMVLSTVNSVGRPSSRIVLLKEITDRGELIFFTNYDSKKGKEMNENSFVALNFFLKELERQVRIEGKVSKTSRHASEDYFNSRPAESRVSAIVSAQSKEIEHIDSLRIKAKSILEKNDLTIPANWGGYLVVPNYYEFWQGGKNRLHDRISYQLVEDKWAKVRLAP